MVTGRSLYADLEESLGTFESAKAVYTRMLELRVANPQVAPSLSIPHHKHTP